MKCPKCEELLYLKEKRLEDPFPMILLKCGYCFTVISTMEISDITGELLVIRQQLQKMSEKNELIMEILADRFNI